MYWNDLNDEMHFAQYLHCNRILVTGPCLLWQSTTINSWVESQYNSEVPIVLWCRSGAELEDRKTLEDHCHGACVKLIIYKKNIYKYCQMLILSLPFFWLIPELDWAFINGINNLKEQLQNGCQKGFWGD